MTDQPTTPDQPTAPPADPAAPPADPAASPTDPAAPAATDTPETPEAPEAPAAVEPVEGAAPEAPAPAEPVDPAAPAGAQPLPPAPMVAPQQEKKGLALLKRFGVPLLVGLAFIGFKVYSSQTAADRLEVGQCVVPEKENTAETGIKKVDCTSAEAKYKVLKIEQNSSESAAETLCGPVEGFTTSYFEGEKDGSKGDLICLGDAK